MADGFSCKEQIAQETNRHGLHLAEVLKLGLDGGNRAQPLIFPEKQFVGPRKAAQKASMVRAGMITVGAIALALSGLLWMKNSRR